MHLPNMQRADRMLQHRMVMVIIRLILKQKEIAIIQLLVFVSFPKIRPFKNRIQLVRGGKRTRMFL